MTSGCLTDAAGIGLGIVKVLLPMANTPEGPRLTIVPSTVTPGSPAEMVVPAIGKAEGFGVISWLATVNTPLAGRLSLLVLKAKIPDELGVMAVPSIVSTGSSGAMLPASRGKPVGLAVKVWLPITKID